MVASTLIRLRKVKKTNKELAYLISQIKGTVVTRLVRVTVTIMSTRTTNAFDRKATTTKNRSV